MDCERIHKEVMDTLFWDYIQNECSIWIAIQTTRKAIQNKGYSNRFAVTSLNPDMFDEGG